MSRASEETENWLYNPLPPGNLIRCLTLQPGLGDEPLEGTLNIVSLDNCPQYEAISYVWGSAVRSQTFVCDGNLTHITVSLSTALHRFRYTEQPRVLWADAICINQGDSSEKGHQVALMGQVYSKASKVLIHMAGEDQGHAPQVASLVSETNSYVQQELGLMDDTGSRSFPYLDTRDRIRISQDPRWKSMHCLLSQPWFKRGWVVQEAALAPAAILVWGSQEIQFDWLLRTAWWAYCRCFETAGTYSTFQALISSGVYVHFFLYLRRFPQETKAYGVCRAKGSEFLDILHNASGTGMARWVDRIFAFLALENYYGPNQAGLNCCSDYLVDPDYTKSAEEIFTEFARQFILRNGLHILQYGYPYDPEDPSEAWSMPSWVPRWGWPMEYQLAKAWDEEALRPSLAFTGNLLREFIGSTLVVTGVVFDEIQFVSQIMSLDGGVEEVASLWHMIKRLALEETYPVEARHTLLIDCLCAGHFSRNMEVTDWLAARDAVAYFLMNGGQRPPEHLVDKVWVNMRMWSRGRRFIATARGLLGMGPETAAEGDVCCIIFGCVWPFVLRPVPGQGTGDGPLFHLLGPAWIAGVTPQHEQSGGVFLPVIGDERSKNWVEWGLKEREIRIV